MRACCLVLLVACTAAQAQFPNQNADLILEGGEIYTPSGWAEAMAIRDGVIVAVGDAAAVAPLRGASTEVIDLAGATVLPGLHDMHVHPQGGGGGEVPVSTRLVP